MPKKRRKLKQPLSDIDEAEWAQLESRHQKKQNDLRQMEDDWRTSLQNRLGRDNFALAERAWAAGFWDGEGHAGVGNDGGFNCGVEQNDRVALERFQKAVGGIGTITGPRRRVTQKGKRQLSYRWKVTNQPDVRQVWESIGQFLTPPKRNQFARVLALPIHTLLKKDLPLPDGAISVEIQPRKQQKE